MDNTYTVGKSDRGKPTITIHRKPSEIPFRIDIGLGRIAGLVHMNGPENYCTYEFLIPERLSKGEMFLAGFLWTRKI